MKNKMANNQRKPDVPFKAQCLMDGDGCPYYEEAWCDRFTDEVKSLNFQALRIPQCLDEFPDGLTVINKEETE